MIRLKTLFFTATSALILCQSPIKGQNVKTDSAKYPVFKFDGILKNKYEYVGKTGSSRFSVRNSRLGVSGKIAPLVDYRAQIELSSEGKFQVLDLCGTLTPLKDLSFTLGQTGIPIFNSYVINPGSMMFANRTFLAKYYAGTRDIGLVAKYTYRKWTYPIGIEFGVYNGNVINDPVWSKDLSYSARLSFGGMKGFRSTVKMYDYPKNEDENYLLYGADLRYEGDNWKVETEIMRRDDKIHHADLTSGYIEGACSFPVKWEIFKYIIPAIRWDAIGRENDNKLDVYRITTGLGFALTEQAFSSLLRLDYEWYFVNNELSFLRVNNEMDANKFTIELVYVF